MKRTALLRKTKLRRSIFMSRSRETKQQLRDGDEPYLTWIRSLPCCACGNKPPSHAHHATGGGMGMKSRDREAMPLCHSCHRNFHDGHGMFFGWGKTTRRSWQRCCVSACVARFAYEAVLRADERGGAPERPR